MKPIADKGFTYIITNRLYWSPAYQSLTKSAKNLMWCMYPELKWTGTRKKKTFSYTNNGKIAFTEPEFKKQGLGASQTYIDARNKLIEVGFIKITYEGGMAKGDMNKYKLLWIDGVPDLQRRWKRYPDENWKHEVPCKKDNMVGRDTRFKKSISTLKNKTLNDTISPNELDPTKVISPDE
jgi:hypothetical protein